MGKSDGEHFTEILIWGSLFHKVFQKGKSKVILDPRHLFFGQFAKSFTAQETD